MIRDASARLVCRTEGCGTWVAVGVVMDVHVACVIHAVCRKCERELAIESSRDALKEEPTVRH